VTPGHPCGSIGVQAKVLHPNRQASFSASAVAHFTSGDVTVALRRAGKSFVAVGRIAVPAGQTAGTVNIVVTITYNGTATTITRTSTITAP